MSRATVSRVISGSGYVGEQSRAKVLLAIEELGFIPNAMARGLKTQRSGLVALLIPEIINSFYTTLARGAEDAANANGLQMIIGNTDERPEKEKIYAELMVSSRVEGVVVASSGSSAKPLRLLIERNVPTVLVDRVVPGLQADIVRGDSFGGALTLTEHLIGLGHRDIALINGHPDTSAAIDREAGFREAMRRAGLPIDESRLSNGSWFIEDAQTRVATMLDGKVPMTAIFGANNFMAIGALRALRDRGFRVPEDVALVSFDDVEVAADINPFLTVMAQPAHSMGKLAMGLLLERINGQYTGEPRELVLTPRLKVRASCGARLRLAQPASEQTDESDLIHH